jgi:hypothetical protein
MHMYVWSTIVSIGPSGVIYPMLESLVSQAPMDSSLYCPQQFRLEAMHIACVWGLRSVVRVLFSLSLSIMSYRMQPMKWREKCID